MSQGEILAGICDMLSIASLGVRVAHVPFDTCFYHEHTPLAAAKGMRSKGEGWGVRHAPYEISLPHDGIGQDDDWVRANFTNATDILAVGYIERNAPSLPSFFFKGGVRILSPNSRVTQVEVDALPSWDRFSLTVDAYLANEMLTSTLVTTYVNSVERYETACAVLANTNAMQNCLRYFAGVTNRLQGVSVNGIGD